MATKISTNPYELVPGIDKPNSTSAIPTDDTNPWKNRINNIFDMNRSKVETPTKNNQGINISLDSGSTPPWGNTPTPKYNTSQGKTISLDSGPRPPASANLSRTNNTGLSRNLDSGPKPPQLANLSSNPMNNPYDPRNPQAQTRTSTMTRPSETVSSPYQSSTVSGVGDMDPAVAQAEKALSAQLNEARARGASGAELAAMRAEYASWKSQYEAQLRQKANYEKGMASYQSYLNEYNDRLDGIEGSTAEALKKNEAAWDAVIAQGEANTVASANRTKEHLAKIESLFTEQKETLAGARTQALQANVQGLLSSMGQTEKSVLSQYGRNSAEYAAFVKAKQQSLATANSGIAAQWAQINDSQYTNFINNYSNLASTMSMYQNYAEQDLLKMLSSSAESTYANQLSFANLQLSMEQLRGAGAENIASMLANTPEVSASLGDLISRLALMMPPEEVEIPDETPANEVEAAELAEAKKNLPVLSNTLISGFEGMDPNQFDKIDAQQFAKLYMGYSGPFDSEVTNHFQAILDQVRASLVAVPEATSQANNQQDPNNKLGLPTGTKDPTGPTNTGALHNNTNTLHYGMPNSFTPANTKVSVTNKKNISTKSNGTKTNNVRASNNTKTSTSEPKNNDKIVLSDKQKAENNSKLLNFILQQFL